MHVLDASRVVGVVSNLLDPGRRTVLEQKIKVLLLPKDPNEVDPGRLAFGQERLQEIAGHLGVDVMQDSLAMARAILGEWLGDLVRWEAPR